MGPCAQRQPRLRSRTLRGSSSEDKPAALPRSPLAHAAAWLLGDWEGRSHGGSARTPVSDNGSPPHSQNQPHGLSRLQSSFLGSLGKLPQMGSGRALQSTGWGGGCAAFWVLPGLAHTLPRQ